MKNISEKNNSMAGSSDFRLFRSPLKILKREKASISRKIAVVPASPGAGASFVAAAFASDAQKPRSLVELGSPHFYLSLNLQKRFEGEKFCFYEDLIKTGSMSEISNLFMDINWLVRRPGTGKNLSRSDLIRSCAFGPEGLVFYDFSGLGEEDTLLLLPEMDTIYLVIDPLPCKLIEAASYIEKIRLLFPETNIVVNKMNKGVFRKELERFLGKCKYTEISYMDPSLVYKAEYNCTLPQYFV